MLPNVGIGEMMLIFMVLLLAVGPKRLPEITRAAGKAYRTFQAERAKAQGAFREALDEPGSALREARDEFLGTTKEIRAEFESPRKTIAGVFDRASEEVKQTTGELKAAFDPHAPAPAPTPRSTPPVEVAPSDAVRDYEDT